MRFERMMLVTGVAMLATTGAPLLAAMDPADAVGVCSRISKKDARLECYDQVARDVASGTIQASRGPSAPAMGVGAGGGVAASQSWSPPPAPQNWSAPPTPQNWSAPPPPGAAAAPQQSSGFGAEQLKRDRNAPGNATSIQAVATSSTDNGLGQWRITLADGAIWQMTERVALFRPPAPQEAITIRQGALGGFLMDVGKQASVRVMRVR